MCNRVGGMSSVAVGGDPFPPKEYKRATSVTIGQHHLHHLQVHCTTTIMARVDAFLTRLCCYLARERMDSDAVRWFTHRECSRDMLLRIDESVWSFADRTHLATTLTST